MNPRGQAALWALLPVVLLLPLLLWLGQWFSFQLASEQRANMRTTLELRADALQRSLDRTEQKLDRLAAFVATETAGGRSIDGGKFNTMAAGLHASATWIRAFQIVADGVITHTYPLAGNETTIGFNLLTAPDKFAGSDVRRALESNRVTVTGPLELIQGGLGVVLRQAIPASGRGPRRLVGIVLNIAPLMTDAGITKGYAADSLLALRTAGGATFFGPPSVFAQQPVLHRISLPDGDWEMGVCPREGWNAGSHQAVWRSISSAPP